MRPIQICDNQRNFCIKGKLFLPHGISRFVMHDQRATSNKLPYDIFLKKMATSGMNTLRLVIPGEFERGVEPEIGRYNPDFLEPLDNVFEIAENLGIQIILILLDSTSFYASWAPDENWKHGVYSGSFKGPKDIFSNSKLRSHLKGRINFLIRHFSKYNNVFAWEVMNEMNKIGELFGDKCEAVTMEWFEDMASYIKSIDDTHLVTTSLYGDEIWESLNKSSNNEFIQIHTYGEEENIEKNENLIEKYIKENSKYDKPVLITEFGTKKDNPKRAEFIERSLRGAQRSGGSALLYSSVWDSDAQNGMGHGDMNEELFEVYRKTAPK